MSQPVYQLFFASEYLDHKLGPGSGDGQVSLSSPAPERKESRRHPGQDWNISQHYIKKFAHWGSISQ